MAPYLSRTQDSLEVRLRFPFPIVVDARGSWACETEVVALVAKGRQPGLLIMMKETLTSVRDCINWKDSKRTARPAWNCLRISLGPPFSTYILCGLDCRLREVLLDELW